MTDQRTRPNGCLRRQRTTQSRVRPPKQVWAFFFLLLLEFQRYTLFWDQNKPSSIINQGVKAGTLGSMTGRDRERSEEGKEGGYHVKQKQYNFYLHFNRVSHKSFSLTCELFLLAGNERQRQVAVKVTSWPGQILYKSLQASFCILSFSVHSTSVQTVVHKAGREPWKRNRLSPDVSLSRKISWNSNPLIHCQAQWFSWQNAVTWMWKKKFVLIIEKQHGS